MRRFAGDGVRHLRRKAGVRRRLKEEVGTSSRLYPLERPKFGKLLTCARPGDIVHISEMFRLVRGTRHILDVLDVPHRDRLALRLHDGAFSAMDTTDCRSSSTCRARSPASAARPTLAPSSGPRWTGA